ncbi:MAG: RiPP maturation radical SAM protein 1 [Candidatus Lokiarchaeota archaeon]|nr:RiPP maturation radical SAM protein 1 [Candidatus Lokiarchaeota archaeon]
MVKEKEVILIVPPFASIKSPSFGVSLIKAVLNEKNINSEIIYANLIFSNDIDVDIYEAFCGSSNSLIGEWFFSSFSFPENHKGPDEYYEIIKDFKIPTSTSNKFLPMEKLKEIKKKIPNFLREISREVIGKNPKIVGLSSNYLQSCASIAIARKIKDLDPGIILVMGGNNCTGVMGKELLKFGSKIDYIFSGEADFEFPNFCLDILYNKNKKDHFISCEPVEDLNGLPYPDYTDYFKQLKKFTTTEEVPNSLPFESSRGCWWGKTSHCIFSGYNKNSINYRQKDPERVKREIIYLYNKYKVPTMCATDTIMPQNFPRLLFSRLKKPEGLENIIYEVRPNLSYEDLYTMRMQGVSFLNAGIETLSDILLKKIRKGTKTLENLRFLRDCRSLGIEVIWGFLCGVPGEMEVHYEEIMKKIPFISHLQPPTSLNSIIIQRFSPLFNKPSVFKIRNLKPLKWYKLLFPDYGDSIRSRLAFYFEGDYPNAFRDRDLENKFTTLIGDWQESWKSNPPLLHLIHLTDEIKIIRDTRKMSKQYFQVIDRNHYRILEFLSLPVSWRKLECFLIKNDLEKSFIDLVNLGFILEDNKRYLSLIIEPMRKNYGIN